VKEHSLLAMPATTITFMTAKYLHQMATRGFATLPARLTPALSPPCPAPAARASFRGARPAKDPLRSLHDRRHLDLLCISPLARRPRAAPGLWGQSGHVALLPAPAALHTCRRGRRLVRLHELEHVRAVQRLLALEVRQPRLVAL
jgi:hypothetical protein